MSERPLLSALQDLMTEKALYYLKLDGGLSPEEESQMSKFNSVPACNRPQIVAKEFVIARHKLLWKDEQTLTSAYLIRTCCGTRFFLIWMPESDQWTQEFSEQASKSIQEMMLPGTKYNASKMTELTSIAGIQLWLFFGRRKK